ncbi:MAG: TIGR03943 family putative permease subunit [Desulfomonilaceae bacterium]
MDSDRSKPSLFRLFQLIVVLAWILSFWFLMRIEGGPLLGKFLRADYWWLVELGIAILVFFMVALVYCGPHDRGRRGVGLVMQMGIMILPLLYLPTAVVSQLSPEAAKKRSFYVAQKGHIRSQASRQFLSSSATDGGEALSSPSLAIGLRENPSLLRLAFEPKPYEGRRVTTTGMVYRDEKLPDNSFFCYQLSMFCCAADARPVGILIEYDKAKTLSRGEWVKVEGIVGFTNIEDGHVPKITAEKVESTKPPKNQYLIP